MAGHQASIPPAAYRYFTQVGVTDVHTREGHPLVTQTFRPGIGWKRLNGTKRVSQNHLRQLRTAGVTHVQLTSGSHAPDFSITELLRSAR